MDVGGIRKLTDRFSTRSARLGAAGCMFLAVSFIWTVRQTRLTQEALNRATAAEKAASQARTDVEETRAQAQAHGQPRKDAAIRRSRHDDPEEIDRVKQLYEEIDNLTRLRDKVEDDLAFTRRVSANKPAATATPTDTP